MPKGDREDEVEHRHPHSVDIRIQSLHQTHATNPFHDKDPTDRFGNHLQLKERRTILDIIIMIIIRMIIISIIIIMIVLIKAAYHSRPSCSECNGTSPVVHCSLYSHPGR